MIVKKLSATASNLPYVFLNLAMTADGKIATADREFVPFGSEYDKHWLLVLRTRADAVMAGARTVDLNPVNLGPGSAKYRRMRIKNGLTEYNLRIVVSGGGTLDPKAEVFQKRFSPIIILTTESAPQTNLERLRALATEVKVFPGDEIDFREALAWLRRKWKVKRLLCEGGGEIDGALFRAGLVDELNLTICPRILGGRNAPTIADGLGIKKLVESVQLRERSIRRVGDELFLVFEVNSADRSLCSKQLDG